MRKPYNIFDRKYWGGDEQHIWGFKEAGDALVEFAVSGKKFAWPEPLFRPIGLLYRHYLEIAMKYWIQKLGREPAPYEHDFESLWDALKPLIEPFCKSTAEHKSLQKVEEVILAFHRYDPSGQEFRYTKTKAKKKEKDTLDNVPPCVDILTDFKDEISQVYYFLEGLSEAVDL